jgi:hypothetical protein
MSVFTRLVNSQFSEPWAFLRRNHWTESESYVTTDGQPASLSRSKEPIWGLRPDLFTCVTVTVLFLWSALSNERSGLSFVLCAAGTCQRSLSRVRVPWDLRPYSTVSYLKLPFSPSPTTRRVTVEVFDPYSTRVIIELTNELSIIPSGRIVYK